jgi:chemotaxis methyl-accepting protein methylase
VTNDLALEEAVDQVTGLLNSHIGLRPEPTLRGRLRRSIRDEATAEGHDPQTYVRGLLADPGALQRLLNRVTVQETSFFRHPEHFDVLAQVVLPALSAPVLIWSAGCANGQEAYSIAMVLDEQGIAGSVIATDLSTAALHRTETARYAAREISGLSPARIARHLTPSAKSWQINDALRSRVTTLRHNLIDPIPEQVRYCQIVFCRNVLIYFSAEHTRTFLDRVADALPRRGYLFLGSAEAIWPLSDRFVTERVGDAFIYRPRPEPAVPQETDHSTGQSRPGGRRRPPSATPRPNQPSAGYENAGVRRRGAPHQPLTMPKPQLSAPDSVQQLAETGQRALDEDRYAPAIIAFRKWVYLTPEDAIAHLHLGLALEAAGDQPSAKRAYGAARRAALHTDQDTAGHPGSAIEGYAPAELLRLLEAKDRGETR